MEKQRIMVYKAGTYGEIKDLVLKLDETYGKYINDVGLYRRIGKYCMRVDATAENSILDEMEALCSQHAEAADLNLTQLIRESESMVGEGGIEYVKKGGIL
jgi:hypothetical protein